MKFFSPEEVFPNSNKPLVDDPDALLTEDEADARLQILLAEPQNAFLTIVPMNKDIIENAKSSREALAYAKRKIKERLLATLNVSKVIGAHTEHIKVNADSVLNTLESIQHNSAEIGRGADGYVVIDIADVVNINPEICYKFAIVETVRRGRNSIAQEAEMQSAFYGVAQSLSSKDIGVPMPFYEVESPGIQMIAMEKLHARSADDIIRGLASLPVWLDVDRFCNSLKETMEKFHAQNLYHRDMHFGNIMISQSHDWSEGDPIGYIVDFGLSSYGYANMEPYKKEVAGYTFTYDDDCGRIESLRKTLKAIQARSKG